ncbi:MAG: DUF4330 domain-containing protein [Vampirovibrionales bacterium]
MMSQPQPSFSEKLAPHFDKLILAIIVIGLVGFLAVKVGLHRTAKQVVKGETDVQMTVFIMNLRTLQPDLFKAGEETALTVRNVPRGALPITHVKVEPKLTLVSDAYGKPHWAPDATDPLARSYTLTLKDHAAITEDGYVSEGIKLKKGLPVELEGFSYRVNGVIVDIQATQAPLL